MLKRIFTLFLVIAFLSAFLPSRSFAKEGNPCGDPNSHAVGDQCFCNDGYENYGGKCKKPYCEDPNSHVVGDQCYCNEGYVHDGSKCRDAYAVCRGFNATYSPAIKNCKCDEGYVEKNNYCVKVEENILDTKNNETEKIVIEEESNNSNDLFESEDSEVSVENSENKDSSNEVKKSIQENKEIIIKEKIDSLMDKYYSKQDKITQEIIGENSGKIEKLKKSVLEPQEDIYESIGGEDSDEKVIIASLKIPIKESLDLLSDKEKDEADDQMKTISVFSDGGSLDDEEISFKEDDILEKVKESAIDESLIKEKNNWKKNLEKAEKAEKFKEGVKKEDFALEREMEKRLKWQITTIEKSIGFEHMRIIEVTGIVKKDKMHQPIAFERMSGDYREYFGNKSAVSNEGGDLAGTAFDKSVKNITGMSKQLKDLKKALKKQYPKNWEKKYLDVPNEPTREDKEKEVEKVGLFNFIDQESKKK